MKTRLTVSDIAAEVACLRATCLGMRVANVYDLTSRTYLLKLSKSATGASAPPLRRCDVPAPMLGSQRGAAHLVIALPPGQAHPCPPG